MDMSPIAPGIKIVMNSIYGAMNDVLCLDEKSQMRYLSQTDVERGDEYSSEMTLQDMKQFRYYVRPVDMVSSNDSSYFEIFNQRESYSELELEEIFTEVTEDYENCDIFEDEKEYLISPVMSYRYANPALQLCGDTSYHDHFTGEATPNRTILNDTVNQEKRKRESKMLEELFNRRVQQQSKGSMPIYRVRVM